MPDDLSGLTPATSDALARLKAGLAAQGFTLGDPISAFRSYEDQRQLYANYLAGKAGQPLPYPNRGPVALAARPGYSPHEFGVAFDTGLQGAALEAADKLAPGLGLATVAGDPGHFQLASWHGGQAAAPNSLVASRSPAPIARPASAAAPGFMDSLAQIESGNQNIYSKVDPDVAGPNSRSQGYFQINTPTWQDFAPKAGVSLKQYPNAMSAPRDVQAQVAAAIPFGRFGQRTQNLMAQQFGPLNTKSTIGELAGSTAPAATSATPSPPTPPAGGVTGALAAAGSPQGQDIASKFNAFDKALGGKGFLGGDQGQGQGQGEPDMPRPFSTMQPAVAHNVPGQAGIAALARQGYSPLTYGQSLNSAPMKGWTDQSPQAPAWMQGGFQPQQAQPYGTGLSGLQMAYGVSPYQLQMLMNPMMLSQSGDSGYG